MFSTRKVWLLIAVIGMWTACPVDAAPMRVAVVWKHQQLDGLGNMLAAKMSKSKDYELVERQELGKLLDEVRLSLLSSGERHFVLEAGKLVRCDVFVCFEVVGKAPFEETILRVFHGGSGSRLARAALPRTENFEVRLRRCIQVTQAALSKARKSKKFTNISLISQTDSTVPADIHHIPELASRLAEWGLVNSKHYNVLERRHLEWISKERATTGAEDVLLPSSLIAAFSVRRSGEQTLLGVKTRRGDGRETSDEFRLSLPLDYAAMAPVLKFLGEEAKNSKAVDFDAGIESVAFFHRSLRRQNNMNWTGALAAAEAAYALNPGELAMVRLLQTCLLSEACAILCSDTDVAHPHIPWAIVSDEASLRTALAHAERAYNLWQYLLRYEADLRKASRFPYLESYLDRNTTMSHFLRVAANVTKGWTPTLRTRFAALQSNYRTYVIRRVVPELQQKLLHKSTKKEGLRKLRVLFAKEIPSWTRDPKTWFNDYAALSNIWRKAAERLSAAEFRLAHPDYRPDSVLEFLLPSVTARRLKLPKDKLADHFDRWTASRCPFISSFSHAAMVGIQFDTLDLSDHDVRRAYERSIHEVAGSAYLEIGRPKDCPFWKTPAHGKLLFYGLMHYAKLLEMRVVERQISSRNLSPAERKKVLGEARTKAALDLLGLMRQRHEIAPVVRQLLLDMPATVRRSHLKEVAKGLASPRIRFCGTQGERDRLWHWLKQRMAEAGVGAAPVAWQEKICLYRLPDNAWSSGPWPYCLRKSKLVVVPPGRTIIPVEIDLSTRKHRPLLKTADALTGTCVGVAAVDEGILVMTRNNGLHVVAGGKTTSAGLRKDCRNVESFCVLNDTVYLKCGRNPEQAAQGHGFGGSRIVTFDLKTRTTSVLADSSRVKHQSPFDSQASFSIPWMTSRAGRLFFTLNYNILQHTNGKTAASGLWSYNPGKRAFQVIRKLQFGSSAAHQNTIADGRILVQSYGRLDAFDPIKTKWHPVAARYSPDIGCFSIADLFRGVQMLDRGRLFLHADEDRRTLKVLMPGDGGAVQLERFTEGDNENIEFLVPFVDRILAFTSNGIYRLRLDDLKLAAWLQQHRMSVTTQPAQVRSGEPFTITAHVPPGTTELRWWAQTNWRDCGTVLLKGKSPYTVQIGPLHSEYMQRQQLGLTACKRGQPIASMVLPPILVRSVDLRRLRRLGEQCDIVVADLGTEGSLSKLLTAAGVAYTHVDEPEDLVGQKAPGILIDGRWMDEFESSALPYLRHVVKRRKNIVIYGPCSYNPFLLSARGFSIPGAIRQLSPADRSHIVARGGRWPASWWREVETGVFQWQPLHGNLHPLLDDKLGRHVIIETYPQIGGKALTVQLPIVSDLGKHEWAERLLVRIIDYGGRPWRPPVERPWQGLNMLAKHGKVATLAKSLYPVLDAKSRVAVIDSKAVLSKTEVEEIQRGGILVMPVPYRGESKGAQRNAELCNGFSDAWMSRISSFVPMQKDRWDKLPTDGYREELIPGMLTRIYRGYGQLIIISVPPKTDRTRMAQEHLAILLTNLRVRLGKGEAK